DQETKIIIHISNKNYIFIPYKYIIQYHYHKMSELNTADSIKRFVDLLKTIKMTNVMDFQPIRTFFADPDNITSDMFVIGKINHPYLLIDIPNVISFDINLTLALQQSIKQHKFKFIDLLIEQNINLVK